MTDNARDISRHCLVGESFITGKPVLFHSPDCDRNSAEYDSEHSDFPTCAFAGLNGSGEPETCIRRLGHPGPHVGMGSE